MGVSRKPIPFDGFTRELPTPVRITCTNRSRVFWHQLMRGPFTAHASFLVKDILHIRQAYIARYLITCFVFLISAGLHIVASPEISFRCAAPAQLKFYARIVGAVLIEDLVFAGYRRIACRATPSEGVTSLKRAASKRLKLRVDARSAKSPSSGEQKTTSTAWLWSYLGYIWVAAFWFWATTKLVYSTESCTASRAYNDW